MYTHGTTSPFPSTSDRRLLSPLTIYKSSRCHSCAGVPADSGNFPWYMTNSIAVLEDIYSEVVVNVIDFALNWQLFSDVGRPRSFVNVMSTNSTLDPCLFVSAVLCFCNCSYVNMNFGSVRIAIA